MILTDTEILALIEKPRNADMLDRARVLLAQHQLHIKGDGVQDFLQLVEGYENEGQANLRRRFAKAATVPVMAPELNTFNCIFSAQGGSQYYDFTSGSDKLKADLTTYLAEDIGDGYNMRQWMREVWLDKVNYDCTGVMMVELPPQINGGDVRPYICWRSVMDMHDVEFSGNKIEYLIFVKVKEDKDGGQYLEYRVIDDARDLLVTRKQIQVMKGGQATTEMQIKILSDSILTNFWGYVPARFMSNMRDSRSRARTSYIWQAIGTLEELLTDASIHSISKKLHGFPIKWMRKRVCGTCKGATTILNPQIEQFRADGKSLDGIPPMVPCLSCRGTGDYLKSDVSDVIMIPSLSSKEDPDNVPVAGYVQPELETLKEQRDEMTWLSYIVHKAIWAEENGQAMNSDGPAAGQKTATEDNNDMQGTFSKLDKVSENAEQMERFLVNTIARARYGNAYGTAIINYGRRYYLRSVAEVEEIYTKAKAAGLASHVLDAYLNELISVKFAYDPMEREVQLKLSYLEPFVHMTANEVKLLGIPRADFLMKVYFNDYIERFEREEKSISLATVEEILEKLKQYNQEKLAEAKADDPEPIDPSKKPPFGAPA